MSGALDLLVNQTSAIDVNRSGLLKLLAKTKADILPSPSTQRARGSSLGSPELSVEPSSVYIPNDSLDSANGWGFHPLLALTAEMGYDEPAGLALSFEVEVEVEVTSLGGAVCCVGNTTKAAGPAPLAQRYSQPASHTQSTPTQASQIELISFSASSGSTSTSTSTRVSSPLSHLCPTHHPPAFRRHEELDSLQPFLLVSLLALFLLSIRHEPNDRRSNPTTFNPRPSVRPTLTLNLLFGLNKEDILRSTF
ncbi:unnamed protein product [Cyclocybe aegerita]|uniref:Uncharacterized protein n=1 Tax=Cyclocybe aegerita TaxID=1973307 RepID=A0A8S0WFG2_CYCAE|nr:unnamed protein product [Cyclocybe aegerita]